MTLLVVLGGACDFTPAALPFTPDAATPVPDAMPVPTWTLIVETDGDGAGTITSEPAGIDCPPVCGAAFARGSEVVLTAAPAAGALFAGWTETCTGNADCVVILDADTGVAARFQPGGLHVWSRIAGTAALDHAFATIADDKGDVYVGGMIQGAGDLGLGAGTQNGGGDAFVIKYTAAGEPVWFRRFGGPLDDVVRNLTLDSSGDLLVSGWGAMTIDFGGGPTPAIGTVDAFVVSLSAEDGSLQWARRYGSSYVVLGVKAVEASSGLIAVAGCVQGVADLDGITIGQPGSYDVFVALLDPATRLFTAARAYGNGGYDCAHGLAATTDGRIWIGGTVTAAIDFGGGTVPGIGGGDVFLAAYDATALGFATAFRGGGAAEDAAHGLDALGEDIVVSGTYSGPITLGGHALGAAGSSEAFVLRMDAVASVTWARSLASAGPDTAYHVEVGGDGNIVTSGFYTGTLVVDAEIATPRGGTDAFVARYLADGTGLDVYGWGSAADEVAWSVSGDGRGVVTLAGTAGAALDLGGGTLPHAGGTDALIWHVAP